ncbi:hypothetical protein K493DRAFT_301445 [Basidiobolus meristosporus CBS 931.73]|uniref:Arrestin-like N-terminal domain-containing protein n=1 Tax=Basidiobolus meristosporus CBS 931.73 TaxID=1314790 RepID=A0A1Y1YBX8_9FUNG|nr:hypothetical protein K493DRAFT_301445 [Basidiobolus meristosporus CBS 931.73]|eukprot:ORX95488.1 hypothetical protein K493DRAFT_301445 [Basidiobolus meristosporus CBS 931.73]
MWYNNSISLQLQSDSIVLHGANDSAPGQMLRGSVHLDIQCRTKISSITVVFKGVASNQHLKPNHDIFYHKEVEFLRTIEVAKDFSPGHYIYHFEIPFPGDLPETTGSSLASVRYKISAVAKRNGLAKNLKDTREVKVLRLTLPTTEIEESQSLLRFGELESELAFCIFSPSVVYSPDNEIPIQIGVDSFKTDLKASEIKATIYEVARSPTQNGKPKTKRTKIRETSSKWNTKSCGKMWIQPIVLPANKDTEKVLSDRDNDYVSVHHELNISILLVKGDTIRKRIVIRTSLQFVDAEALEAVRSLPCYEQSMETPPCY